MRASRLVCVLALAGLLAACGSNGRSVEFESLVPREPGNLTGTDWLLVATGDGDLVPASTSLSLRIEDSTASGNGPCNRFHLAFAHSGEDVTTGPVASTRLLCTPGLMAAESTLFRDLEAVDTAQMESDQLVLSGPDDLRLAFEPAGKPADEIAGSWRIANFATPETLRSAVAGSRPTMDFGDGDALTVEPGCNTAHSTWTAHDRSLTIGPARATQKACAAAAGVMLQEANILSTLPRVATVDVAHDTALLLDATGATMLVLVRPR